MEQIETEAQGLIYEFLFAAAEKFIASGIGCADVAGRWHASRVKSRVRSRRDVQEDLPTEQRGPNRLVTLEAIAIERIVPARFCVDVFAGSGIAAILGLRKRPAIRHSGKNVRSWR